MYLTYTAITAAGRRRRRRSTTAADGEFSTLSNFWAFPQRLMDLAWLGNCYRKYILPSARLFYCYVDFSPFMWEIFWTWSVILHHLFPRIFKSFSYAYLRLSCVNKLRVYECPAGIGIGPRRDRNRAPQHLKL